MKRLLTIVACLAGLGLTVFAQTPAAVTGALSAANCPALTGCVVMPATGWGSVGIQVSGTFTGTITFEASLDNSTYTALSAFPSNSTTSVTTTTGTGLWNAGIGGFAFVRARMSSYTSGTARVTLQPAMAGGVSAAAGLSPTGDGTGLTFNTGSITALGGNFSTVGAFPLALTVTGTTGLTLPTTGTVAVLSGGQVFSTNANAVTTLKVSNTTSGTAAVADVQLANDTGTGAFVRLLSSGFTSSGANIANGMVLESDGSGGISVIAASGTGAIRFYSGGTTQRGGFTLGGQFLVGNISAAIGVGQATVDFNGGTTNGIALNDNASASGSGFLAFLIGAANIGSVARVGATSAVVYNTTSDQRLKNDLGVVKDLSGLRGLVVHDFTWKSDPSGYRDRGVFAQEAYTVLSRGVTVGADNTLGADGLPLHPWQVSYSAYIPDLVAGWQQHDARLSALETELRLMRITLGERQ